MKTVIVNGERRGIEDNMTAIDIFNDAGEVICGVYADNDVKANDYVPKAGETLRPVLKSDPEGERIFYNTLSLLLARAAVDLDKNVKAMFSVAGGIYFRFTDKNPMSPSDVKVIRKGIKRLVDKALPIRAEYYSYENAKKILAAVENLSSGNLMEYMGDEIKLYNVGGFYGYFYTRLLTNTDQIDFFDVVHYDGGCILFWDENARDASAEKLRIQRKLFEEMLRYDSWCARFDVSDIVSINNKIKDGSIVRLITYAETRYEQMLMNAAREIYDDYENKRIILIAGPSSAGKTTTSKRLMTHLTTMGLSPVTIAMDDYFIDRDKTPLDEYGQPDFESVRALDIELFNENLVDLMAGKETVLPVYDFKTGKSIRNGRTLIVDEKSPIIIEGIHGLNDALTDHIPRKNKYKIYINDLTHLNIDNLNRIPTSDVRLVRRITRDNVQRGHDALATIAMWQSVRRGEEKNIFPYAGEADFVVNSSLFYELGVLKKYSHETLTAVSRQSEYYSEARRILKYLSFFMDVEDETTIYANSVLREFIGGSIYDKI
ncbi:MAG: nucleoside kinase [Eubacteriaceae bacterium]|nr:nucleoside kinase [Eubacteriaceae bacterium]